MAFTAEQMERYSRHFVLSEIGVIGQKKLMEAKVLVVGAGALGSAAIQYLASAGIGTLGIMDGDTVELSNLQRQIIHGTNKVGVPKVESAAERVRELNPDVRVICYPYRLTVDNAEKLISGYDLVIDAVDSFGSKLLINDACVLQSKPFVHAGIVRFGGQIMTWIPGKGACLRCILGEAPDPDSCETCSTHGVLGAATGVLGSMEALEAVKVILGIGETLSKKILFFDGLNMQTHLLDLGEKSPYCPICSGNTVASLKELKDDYR